MSVDYLEDGILFCGHFLSWSAEAAEVRLVAQEVAAVYGCRPETIGRILAFELEGPQRLGIA